MPRKRLSPEQDIVAKPKKLDLTLDELWGKLMADSGHLNLAIKGAPKGHSLRLIIRVKNPEVPQAWAMALLLDNVRIASIDFHVTDYTDVEGIQRVGWHQDTLVNGKIQRMALQYFSPEAPDLFMLDGFALLNIALKAGEPNDSRLRLHS